MSSADGKFSILTSEGEYFWYKRPQDSVYGINVVAHALAQICRFGGHCHGRYSVAQHCVLMARLVLRQTGNVDLARLALMHEVGEVFMGDMPAPLKWLLPEYRTLEKQIEAEGFARFGIKYNSDMLASIKWYDRVMLATEQRDLMRNKDLWTLTQDVPRLRKRIRWCWPVWYARWQFKRTWRRLAACTGQKQPYSLAECYAVRSAREFM